MFVLREMIPEPIYCNFCDKKIENPTRSQKYCDGKCREDARLQRQENERKKKKKSIYYFTCKYCQVENKTYDKRRVYCNDECKRLFNIKDNKRKRTERQEIKKGKSDTIDSFFLKRTIT